MKTHWLVLAATAALAPGCYSVESPPVTGVGSFRIQVSDPSTVNTDNSVQPLGVVPACVRKYGTLEQVPTEVRGTADCRYVIPPGAVEMTVSVTALGKSGEPYDFNGPVSFKLDPGDLAGDYGYAWVMLEKGTGQGKLRAQHLYGEVRVLVADEPVELLYANGAVTGDLSKLPPEPASRTYASSASAALHFQEPTLTAIQTPQGYDNRSSPFTGQFVTVGRAPEAGGAKADCPVSATDDAMMLLVTGTDPSGFFVTDVTACPVLEDTTSASGVRVPEPPATAGGKSYLPGRYGSMFVYNYSFPEGLYPGDLLWTLAGSIQEFTSTTQLTFPSWTVREHVRQQPQEQWEKYLKLNPPVELNLRHCFLDNTLAPFITDVLCGYNNKNLKLESLESALVKLRQVRFPKVFKSCDLNGDGSVPFFCQTKDAAGNWIWGTCDSANTAPDPERQCNADCTTGSGDYTNTVCAERTQYQSFGQFVVEMAGPGPRDAGLDDTLSARSQTVTLSDTTSRKTTTALAANTQVSLWCDQDVYLRWGDASVTAGYEDEPLSAQTRQDVTVSAGKGYVAFLSRQATSGVTPAPRCYVSANTHTRMLLITRDAVPDLVVDCDEADTNADRAQQCRYLHGATFDAVGHLRQVQAARPRWMVMPRDAGDLCCHPGPGLQCPRPIQPCK